MKKTAIIIIICLSVFTFSQEDKSANFELGKNIIKINLMPLAIKNYSFQFERVLSKRVSIAVGFSYMPERNLPFVDEFKKILNDGDNEAGVDSQEITDFVYENFKIGHYAITPELRFYIGKGYGKGFYFAPYYRFAKINTESIQINYERDNGNTDTLDLKGDISSHSGGLMLGSSFNLGKHFVLDWWIVGLHYGSATGSLNTTTSYNLSSNEQQQIKDFLNDLNTGVVKIENQVNANGVKVILDGPWGGIRTGLSLGYRF